MKTTSGFAPCPALAVVWKGHPQGTPGGAEGEHACMSFFWSLSLLVQCRQDPIMGLSSKKPTELQSPPQSPTPKHHGESKCPTFRNLSG